jgi:nitrogen fixation NifU-like protein
MAYSSKLLDYFENPRCAGELPDANAIAEVSNPICGDAMKLWLKVDGNRIIDAPLQDSRLFGGYCNQLVCDRK